MSWLSGRVRSRIPRSFRENFLIHIERRLMQALSPELETMISTEAEATQFMHVAMPAIASGDVNEVARVVTLRWTPKDLCPLLGHGDANVRRVTAITLGLVGDGRVISCLARTLHDADGQVNEMAEHAMLSIWFRLCQPAAAEPFKRGMSLLADEHHAEAVEAFEQTLQIDGRFGEAWNQCAIAQYFMGHWQESIACCKRTLNLIPSHFCAVAGMGHCHTQLGQYDRATRCYRKALEINPRMTAIARMIQRVEERQKASNEWSGVYVARR